MIDLGGVLVVGVGLPAGVLLACWLVGRPWMDPVFDWLFGLMDRIF